MYLLVLMHIIRFVTNAILNIDAFQLLLHLNQSRIPFTGELYGFG